MIPCAFSDITIAVLPVALLKLYVPLCSSPEEICRALAPGLFYGRSLSQLSLWVGARGRRELVQGGGTALAAPSCWSFFAPLPLALPSWAEPAGD